MVGVMGMCLGLTYLIEVIVVHQPMSVARLIVVSQQLQDFSLFQVKSQRAHGDFEFMVVNRAVLVCVEEFEGFFNFLFLLFADFWTRMSTSFCFLNCC